MKLLACHVENFGKLSDFSMDFSEGLNTVMEENGWGKTTLAAFLKAMFYGLEPRKESGAYDRERVMYRPWQGGTYGGTLDFAVGEKSYRVSRTFGRTEKTDEFHLQDLATMLESQDYSANLGVELFDLDSASFKRSIFIAQSDCGFASTDSINAKLGNLAENTNDVNNYESAYRVLKDAMNRLTPNRATGSIRRRQQLITQLEAEIQSLDAAQEGYTRIQQLRQEKVEQKETLQMQREALAQSLKEAGETSALLEKRTQYCGLKEEEAHLAGQCWKYEESFPAGIPSEEDLYSLTGVVHQMTDADAAIRSYDLGEEDAQEYERLHELYGDTPPDMDTVNSYLEKQRTYSSNGEKLAALKQEQADLMKEFEENPLSKRPDEKVHMTASTVFGILLVVAAAVLLLAATVGVQMFFAEETWVRYAPMAGLIAAGVILLIAAIFFGMGGRKKRHKKEALDETIAVWDSHKAKRDAQERDLKEEIDDLEKSTANLELDIREFLVTCHKESWEKRYVSAMYELSNELEHYARLRRMRESQDALCEEKAKLQEQVDEFARKYQLTIGSDITSELSNIRTQVAEHRLAKQSYDRAVSRTQQFEAANNMEQLLAEGQMGPTVEEVNASIRDMDAQIEEVRKSIEQYNRQMEDLQKQIDQREEREEELSRTRMLQEEELHRYEILECTQDYLQKAKERFTARYMEPISSAFRKYYDRLLAVSGEWQIDANIQFAVREHGQLRQTQTLSAGYQDMIGICMRLALVDVMYEGEKPFLILDDPFVNLDDEKQAAGMRLLTAVAKEYQIVYFTCHTSRVPGDEPGAEVLESEIPEVEVPEERDLKSGGRRCIRRNRRARRNRKSRDSRSSRNRKSRKKTNRNRAERKKARRTRGKTNGTGKS